MVSIAVGNGDIDSWALDYEAPMSRFFAIAILLNWIAVLAFLGAVGFGASEGANGLLNAGAAMLSAHPSGLVTGQVAQSTMAFLALIVFTTALWALMASIFAHSDGSETGDEDFVVMAALAICLTIFAVIAGMSVWFSNSQVGALAAVASFATLLTGIAHRICIIEAKVAKSGDAPIAKSFSSARAGAMAGQSATLANVGARSSRFVPKRPFQP